MHEEWFAHWRHAYCGTGGPSAALGRNHKENMDRASCDGDAPNMPLVQDLL